MGLREYHRKRRFDRTPEPRGRAARPRAKDRVGTKARAPARVLRRAPKGATGRFTVHKHRATRLHYDLRLELDGVLLSWAIPKGPSLDPDVRRLAVRTEDHPLEYLAFEDVIPEGEYGAGEMIVWDTGTWRWNPPAPGRRGPRSPRLAAEEGKLDFVLDGEKLRGRFVLVRSRAAEGDDKEQWILRKVRDELADAARDIVAERPASVLTRRTVEELRLDGRPAPRAARRRRRARFRLAGVLSKAELARAPARPPPERIAPMLPTLVESVPAREKDWVHEIKLDGVRVIAWKRGGAVRIVSRAGNPLERQFPEVAAALARLPVEAAALLDGELCIADARGRTRFQLIQPRLQVADEAAIARLARDRPAVFHVFDALHVEGRDLRALSLEARKRVAERLLEGAPGGTALAYVRDVDGRGEEFFALACEQGLEGIVAKRKGSPYFEGRTRHWVKVKCGMRVRFVIGGATEYETTKKGTIGGLLLGLYRGDDLVYVGGVGTGFDAAARRDLHARLSKVRRKTTPFVEWPGSGGSWRSGRRPKRILWVEPRLVCECRIAEFTADAKVRHASFLGLRDVDPRSCVFAKEAEVEVAKRLVEESSTSTRRVAGRSRQRASAAREVVGLTNLDKVWFPDDGITKGDVIAHYERVADALLPHLRDRPMVLYRMPDGIAGHGFYQKNQGDDPPPYLRVERIWSEESERFVHYAIVDDLPALLYCVQLGAISLSAWSSRVGHLDTPDWSIIDIDPGDRCTFDMVVETALLAREILDELGLRGYPKTSGATGIHVHVPLAPRYDYEAARTLAEVVARIAEARRPDLVTLVRTVRRRPRDKVYVDYLQNARGKTVVSAYSVRERPRAPVSTPLRWEEVNRRLRPERFRVDNFPARLAKVGDLWRPVLEDRQRLEKALAAARGRIERR